jgi:hypothetical protein
MSIPQPWSLQLYTGHYLAPSSCNANEQEEETFYSMHSKEQEEKCPNILKRCMPENDKERKMKPCKLMLAEQQRHTVKWRNKEIMHRSQR